MISYKVCLLGAFSVGKTSLVKRYVESIFSEKYETTIGVKIAKHSVQIDDEQVQLLLWDMEGKDAFTEINTRYLRGASGLVLVADGTRPDSVDDLFKIYHQAQTHISDVPIVVMLNKHDLAANWAITDTQLKLIDEMGWQVFQSSAKTGKNVDVAFSTLGASMLAGKE